MREQKEDCKMAKFGESICIYIYIFIYTYRYVCVCFTHKLHGSGIFTDMNG